MQKYDYGIYLGMTYSAIARMEKGEPVIIKSDGLKDTMPSCVSVDRKGFVIAGDHAFIQMKIVKRQYPWRKKASNNYVEFMRTMGTDAKYPCSNLHKDFTSEELSAEVLKALKSFVTDEAFCSVVITVPAKFTVGQKTATIEAAKMAGFTQCKLLQEPIAASMAYGLSADEKNGIWMVFDFGGGTFDAALLKVEDGIMQVFDTEGDNYLGGKNLDYAIVDNILIPYLRENYAVDGLLAKAETKEVLRDAMKTYAEDAKNQLSFKDHVDIISNLGDLGEDEDGEEIELDLTLTQDKAFSVMRPLFQKAVDICKELLKRNNLKNSQVSKLILVGGPTHSPLIREMLREQVTSNLCNKRLSETIFAEGAAIYASTIRSTITVTNKRQGFTGIVKLELQYDSTTVESVVYIHVKLADDNIMDKVWVEFARADGAWASERTEIDKNGDVFTLNLLDNKPNAFSIRVYDSYEDLLPCFPLEIIITQGIEASIASLSYTIGVGVWSQIKKSLIFHSIKGLERNRPLPAMGVISGLHTDKDLHPGFNSDIIAIPFYQADGTEVDGMPAKLFYYIGDLVISGEDITEFVPRGSVYDITCYVDRCEIISFEVIFPKQRITIHKALEAKKISLVDAQKEVQDFFLEARFQINELMKKGLASNDLQGKLSKIEKDVLQEGVKITLLRQKQLLRKIEERMRGKSIIKEDSISVLPHINIKIAVEQGDQSGEALVCLVPNFDDEKDILYVILQRLDKCGFEDGWFVQGKMNSCGDVLKVQLSQRKQTFKISGYMSNQMIYTKPNLITINI